MGAIYGREIIEEGQGPVELLGRLSHRVSGKTNWLTKTRLSKKAYFAILFVNGK